MHMIGNCNFFTMLLIFHCSLQLVLDQVKITQDHRISKSFLSSTIKAQSLFWRSSLNQSLHASIDSREIWKEMRVLVLQMKDLLICCPPYWSPCPCRQNDDQTSWEHHLLGSLSLYKPETQKWTLNNDFNLKHKSEQWLHQPCKALHCTLNSNFSTSSPFLAEGTSCSFFWKGIRH